MEAFYTTCQGMDCNYVVKVQKENKEYYTEIEALLSLQHTKAVPKVFAAWTCKNVGYFVIEKLYPCKYDDNFIWKEVGKKLDIIRRAGYLHLDICNDNVMCNKEGEVILIDFGFAIKRTEQGDEQEYVTKTYGTLTWKDLEMLQEESRNYFFNPAALTDSDPKSITEEHKLAHEKATKNYNDVQEKIRKQKGIGVKPVDESTKPIKKLSEKDVKPVGKQIVPPRLQVHLNYQNGIIRRYPTWEKAKDEISSGKKKGHWIWYVFPSFLLVREHSIPDLILKDLDEVKAYIANDVLRKRLIEITNIARMQLNKGIKDYVLFHTKLDALKFWECITLFFLVSDNGVSLELHEVCDKALSALHPSAQMQDRLEPNTVNAFIQAEGEILEQKRRVEVNSESLLKNSALRLLRAYSKKETNEDAINFLLNNDLRGKENFQLNDITFTNDEQIIGMSSAPLWSITLSATKDGITVPLYNNYDGMITFY